MSDGVVAVDEVASLRPEIQAYPAAARDLTIDDEASFQGAATFLRRIKAVRETITRVFGPHIARAFAAHRALVADRQRLEAPLAEAERVLKAKLARFAVEEERRRATEARRQMAAAAEARATQIWTEVEALEAAGAPADAADLALELVRTPAPIVVTPTPVTADGLVHREVWKYAVVDPTHVPREYLCIDHKKLGGVVRALKGVARIPGVRVWAERTIAASTR